MSVIGDVVKYVAYRRHKRRCDLCGEPILRGQPCIRWTWKSDGLTTCRVHQSCDEEAKNLPEDWYQSGEEWPCLFPLREERAEMARQLPITLSVEPSNG